VDCLDLTIGHIGSLFLHFWSIKLTILVALLLRGYYTSASYDALFFYVASTYWKPASTTLLDLPTVDVATFLKIAEVPLCYLIQVRSAVLQHQHLVCTSTF
jgi:hypothetical protein